MLRAVVSEPAVPLCCVWHVCDTFTAQSRCGASWSHPGLPWPWGLSVPVPSWCRGQELYGQCGSAAPGTALGFSPSAQFSGTYRGGMALGRAPGWDLTCSGTGGCVLSPPGTEVLCSFLFLRAVFSFEQLRLFVRPPHLSPAQLHSPPVLLVCLGLTWGLRVQEQYLQRETSCLTCYLICVNC